MTKNLGTKKGGDTLSACFERHTSTLKSCVMSLKPTPNPLRKGGGFKPAKYAVAGLKAPRHSVAKKAR